MKAYLDLDSGIKMPADLDALGVDRESVFLVSRSELQTEGKQGVVSGDIFAMLNVAAEPHSAYVSRVVGKLPNPGVGREIVCFGPSSLKSEEIVDCVQNLSMRASVAKVIDSRALVDCSYVIAPADFWERLFLVHARWYRNRMVDPGSRYPDAVINFCISLYEYEVVFA